MKTKEQRRRKARTAKPTIVKETPLHSEENIQVPLNRLMLSPSNVRSQRKSGGHSIPELAALIKSQTLLQRLIVVPATDRKKADYEVTAGGRRLQALNLLVKQKHMAPDALIDCKRVASENATAASLAENSGREAMHPADQFLAFNRLVHDEGKSVAEVAAAFGVSELTVTRRLKLAQVSPRLFELYRDDKMTLEQLMQFTLTSDHAKQEHIWKGAAAWQRDPRHLRALLVDDKISATDPLAIFVGVDAYKTAGGDVLTDLFSDKGDGFLTDGALLNQLAQAKLAKKASKVRDAGWKWVEVRPRCGHSDLAAFRRVEKGHREPTAKEAAKLKTLESAVMKANHEIEASNDDDSEDRLYDTLGRAETALAQFMKTLEVWTPDQLAVAGAVVTLDERGCPRVHQGLVRAEDQKQLQRVVQAKAAASGEPEATQAGHSEKLTAALTAHRNAAIQALLVKRQEVALVMLAHSLVLQCFERYHTSDIADPLQVRATPVADQLRRAASDIEQSPATVAFAHSWRTWEKLLPEDGNTLFSWLLALPPLELQELLTLCVAASVNTLASRDAKGLPGQVVASTLGLNMADWWQPTADSYLKHISKAQIIAAVTTAKSADAAKALPLKTKGELVAAAAVALSGTGWLPAVLSR